MKQKVLLIGGGVITLHYKKGLESSETMELVGFADINPNCPARNTFSVPFFHGYKEALSLHPDAALLALPVPAKFPIATDLLHRGIAVMTEKPMCESYEAIQALFATSNQTKTPLSCLFHWKAAEEVRFLKENLRKFGKIIRISTKICDDYAREGIIRLDRRGLDGAWLDSGINVLSYFDEIIDLTNTRLIEEKQINDRTGGQAKYTLKRFRMGETAAEIIVDWTTASRDKTSEISTESGMIFVDHTKQTVTLNGKTIFSAPTGDRLSSHYENLFRDFTPARDTSARTLLLHKILFEGTSV